MSVDQDIARTRTTRRDQVLDWVGTRRDWRLMRPRRPLPPRPGVHWIGPLIVAATSLGTWGAFAGTAGEDGDVSFALYIGSVSIALMAWSFVLALRVGAFEGLFGGLDRVYRTHRWCGAVAVVAMYLHTSFVDEPLDGIRGASRSVANSAEDLAGTAQTLLYILVGVSLVRMVPYRWWRHTHKFLGVPFVFASFHFYTAEKPFATTSGWGWYFNVVMLAGIATWGLRVVGLDRWRRGPRYRIVSIGTDTAATDLRLEACGRPLRHRPGQFAFLRLEHRGRGESHPFSFAGPPRSRHARFVIRPLGDWSDRLASEIEPGDTVRVEGPYGRFAPLPRRARPTIWVAGGVGITPFLSAIDSAAARGVVPDLLYAVRDADTAVALEELRDHERAGRLRLHLFASDQGRRLTPAAFADCLGDIDLRDAHIALCGPQDLIATIARAAVDRGARHVEHEDFDIRSGLGPDWSRRLDTLARALRQRVQDRRVTG